MKKDRLKGFVLVAYLLLLTSCGNKQPEQQAVSTGNPTQPTQSTSSPTPQVSTDVEDDYDDVMIYLKELKKNILPEKIQLTENGNMNPSIEDFQIKTKKYITFLIEDYFTNSKEKSAKVKVGDLREDTTPDSYLADFEVIYDTGKVYSGGLTYAICFQEYTKENGPYGVISMDYEGKLYPLGDEDEIKENYRLFEESIVLEFEVKKEQ